MKRRLFLKLTSLGLAGEFVSRVGLAGQVLSSSHARSQAHDWQELFNGKNFDGWETYLGKPDKALDVKGLARNGDGTYKKAIGMNKDPLNVFSVVTQNDEPAIRVSGKVFGDLTTLKSWSNYHLSLQFKWGKAKWPPRENARRDAGLLYDAFGPQGGGDGVNMKSHEFQIQHTDVGDYYAVGGAAMDIPAKPTGGGDDYIFTPGARPVSFSDDLKAGRHCKKRGDFEKPLGEWNTLDLYTHGATSVHVVNRHPVMVLHNSRYLAKGQRNPLTRGRIQLQSEGSEIYYRHIKIRTISHIPAQLLT